ncbi:myomegalin isoform X5 [Amia ocellicauda]|uniref:myomegalin isoform X5 n=1 Tax=Amia ocellicauda TaxID=2972642 RepID=UPI0034649B55
MLDSRMKDVCRICARELCGNQRRWIFHTAAKLNLQVLLSHVLGRELTRDGKGEFACSKCTFMLDRMYRFDTVIARIEALSIERLQKLLLEKDRLRQCISGLYRKHNGDEPAPEIKAADCTVDISGLPDVKYNALLQEDFAYSVYESWAEHEEQTVESHYHHCHMSEVSVHRSRRCRGCAALRVADSDYEAVCRVPRKLARSISCGPSTRYSASLMGSMCSVEPTAVTPVPETPPATSTGDKTLEDADLERMSPGSSVESLDTAVEMGPSAAKEEEAEREMREDQKSDSWSEEHLALQGPTPHANRLDLALSLVKNFEYRPIQSPRGSKLPILVKSPGSNSKIAFTDLTVRTPYSSGSEFPTHFQELVPPRIQHDLHLELSELEELWQDIYVEYMPFHCQNLIEEQQSQLNQYECAAGQCVSELQKAQLQVQALQTKIHETENTNKKLQEKLQEMECELRAIRQAAQKQERTIQGLSETVSTKDTEAEELYRVIEGQNDTLCKLREIAHRNQLQQMQMSDGEGDPAQLPQLQTELLALQNSLFSTQLELQGSQRAQRHSERQAAAHARSAERLQSDLQEALQHRELTERHNQELRSALQQARAELQTKEQLVKEKDSEKRLQAVAQESTMRQLRLSLQEKEQLVQEYMDLLDHQQDSTESRDTLLDKLRERIKDRDRALERAIDDKFRCLEEKEAEVRRLQLAHREKERDLERLRCILSNNEETITSLDGLLKVKELELEQSSVSCRNLQWLKQETEERLEHSLRERDAIVAQLQTSLQSRTKEAEELTAVLLNKVSVGGGELAEELKLRLQLKERLFQEVLADRARQAAQHEREVQELLGIISTRDQQIRDTVARLTQVIGERTGELQELRRHLAAKEREMGELSREKEQLSWDPRSQISHLKSLLREKEAFIQELMQGSPHDQDEPMITSKPGDLTRGSEDEGQNEGLQRDMQEVQEELQLVLRKEQEAQRELLGLQSVLAKQKEEVQIQASNIKSLTCNLQIKEELIQDLQRQLVDPSGLPVVERLTQELQELRQTVALLETSAASPNHQVLNVHQECVLEHLVSEYNRLNEALKTEKQLYHSLSQLHTHEDSSEQSHALQVELNTVQALRGQLEEALARTHGGALRLGMAAETHPDFGELSTEEEDEDEEDDDSSEFTDSIEEEENSKLTALTLSTNQKVGIACEQGHLAEGPMSRLASRDVAVVEQGLVELRGELQQLMEQKRTVKSELAELKTQLENTGYASLSQMRNALLSLRLENDELKGLAGQGTWGRWEKGEAGRLSQEADTWGGRLGGTDAVVEKRKEHLQLNCQIPEEEGPELAGSVVDEGDGRQEELGPAQGKRCAPVVQHREGRGKRRCTRPHSLDLGALLSHCPGHPSTQPEVSPGGFWEHVEVSLREQTQQLRTDLALSRQESRDLQEQLMVSEATVQAQAEQLKEYRVLLTESSVEQDSKQVQVDLQDLGYETCGRSENEAEREDASSPEYEDLDVHGPAYTKGPECSLGPQPLLSWVGVGELGECEDVAALQQHIQDLRGQLRRSDKIIRNLQSRVRSFSTTSDYASSLERPRKVNWSFQASPSHSGLEEDEGWQSDGLGVPPPQPNKELQELVLRVASLEAQLKSSRLDSKTSTEDLKSATWPGKYDSLIQAQARELSHLRQKMREGRGVCHILFQHLGDTTKSFEELLRANDIDYYMGQSFREQLAQSTALADRVNTKLSGRDRSELDDKTGHELLALRLSKELQQKDKIIDSLRNKLQQRPDTPSSSHAFSESTDQSDRTSFVSDDHGSTNEDLELCSDVDGASEYTQEEQGDRESPGQASTDSHCHGGPPPQHPSIPSSTTASHGTQSSNSSPNLPCTQCKPLEPNPEQKGLNSSPPSSAAPFPQPHYCPDPSGQPGALPFDPHLPLLGPSYHGAAPFSLAEVHQELQMLQRQLGETAAFAVPQVKPLPNFPLTGHAQPECSSYLPLSHHPFHQPKLSIPPIGNGILKAETSLLGNNAVWDMAHPVRPIRAHNYGDVSSGSSGYQSGTSHTGADLIEEHLNEIRSLRQRLEDSIRTNDRLRQQLEERLATAGRDSGPPTNIYIQGLESVSQLSNENRVLREENLSLQARLSQANRESTAEAEQLREAVLAGRAQLKQLELEAEQWREESRQLQGQSCEQLQELQKLRQERQAGQERNNRLQHEVNLLQQQLSESHQLLRSLQCELQVYDRVCGTGQGPLSGYGGEVKYHGAPTALELNELLAEVRSLRVQLEHNIQENSSLRQQLEQQLERSGAPSEPRPTSISIMTPRDGGCRRQLFQDPVPSPPVRDTGLFNPGSPFALFSKSTDLEEPDLTGSGDILKPKSVLEGEAPDGSFANKNGRHAIGHVDDFSALQQQILEGKVLVHKMEAMLQASLNTAILEVTSDKALDYSCVKTLLSNAKTLRQILEEATSLLKMFWRAALPSGEGCTQHFKKEQSMKEEIHKLRQKITEQEGLLQNTIERLRNSNRTKESMEHFIVGQLSRTRDVLKKARTNLEKNEYQISSLSSSSPCPGKAESPRLHRERPSDWSFMTPRKQESARKKAAHRSAKKRSGLSLLQVVTY